MSSVTATIRFSADILRRLGEELNPSIDKGILELVKNSYDADATSCVVELHKTDAPGGSITVHDNGDGLTQADILNGWLLLGKSEKTKKRITSRLKRTIAGSKGLGRLAALRMGTIALLTTRPRSQQVEHNLLIDWRHFDEAETVDEVPLSIEESKCSPDVQPGTEVRIESLHKRIGRWDVKRLARELVLLADPFGDASGFSPTLIAPEFKDLEKLVKNRYFDDAEFHLVAKLDNDGRASATVEDWKGETLFEAAHEGFVRGKDAFDCPPAVFDLWVFILNKKTFSTRSSSQADVKTWLREFGGVHVYYNGLRVGPYGDEGGDWLDMNLRRVRSPEERPSTNTSIGRVTIIDKRERLQQKTDRSGFIEDGAFSELRQFATNALDWMASRRLEEAEKRRAQSRVSAPKKARGSRRKLEEAIEEVPDEARENIFKAFEQYDKSRDREVSALSKEVQLYRTLSTAGITAATFAHESSGNPIKIVTISTDAIERRGKTSLMLKYDEILARPVGSIRKAIESLSVLGTATLKVLDHGKRRLSRVDLHDVITSVLDTFRPFLNGRDVTVEMELCAGDPFLRASEAAIESIMTNLLNNCLAAFETAGTTARIIRVATEIEGDLWTLRVLDNGPGIEGLSANEIWLPGKSTRRNGTGLGLTIVKDATTDMGGTVSAIEQGPLGGAEIRVTLPILGR